jgi:hypothetical protein
MHDIAIIGAGPAGLAFAQCSVKAGLKVIVIDKEADIGGCHRVRRVPFENESLFTEHGPRIYTSSYVTFKEVLKDLGTDFHDLFTPYNFQISKIGGETIWSTLSWKELLLLVFGYFQLFFNHSFGKDTSMHDFMTKNNFKEDSYIMIDRICRLTDGATADKYTLYQFLSLINHHFFYGIYQPKKPNDIGLFKIWRSKLEERGVTFMTNAIVFKVNPGIGDKLKSIDTIVQGNKVTVQARNFVFAQPPVSLHNLLKQQSSIDVRRMFGDDLGEFAKETAYIDYLSCTFHWKEVLQLEKVYGFPDSDWGIAFIVLTDYMRFDEDNSKTVISIAITDDTRKSKRLDKSVNECSEKELLYDILEQLRESFPSLPDPSAMLLSPGVVYDTTKNAWVSLDTAYVSTPKEKALMFGSNIFKNAYNVGSHNQKHTYPFTTLESAVTNAITLFNEFGSNLQVHNPIPIRTPFTLNNGIMTVIVIVIVIVVLQKVTKKEKGSKILQTRKR